MTSRPSISYNPRGEVTMSIETGSSSIYMKFSPDVAETISREFANMAAGARKILRENQVVDNGGWVEGPPAGNKTFGELEREAIDNAMMHKKVAD